MILEAIPECAAMEYAVNIYRMEDDSFIRQLDVFQTRDAAQKAADKADVIDGEYADVVAIEYDEKQSADDW